MVSIIFIDSEIIETTNYVTYNLQNFVADIGGLAGLFLGFSLLTLFEIILGMTRKCRELNNRLIRKRKRQRKVIFHQSNVYRPQIRIVNEMTKTMDKVSTRIEANRRIDRLVYNKW